MCYVDVLPTAISIDNVNDEVMRLAFILNKWTKSIFKYGKIDGLTINKDFTTIAKAIQSVGVSRKAKNAIRSCRDCALTQETDKLVDSLARTLQVLCEEKMNPMVLQIKSHTDDQGMTEKYRPLSRRLSNEYIRKLNKDLLYADVDLEDSKRAKLVRRIVEKRAAQQVYKNCKGNRDGNRFRQDVRRAKSFSLFYCTQCDSNTLKRDGGSHWKVAFGDGTDEMCLKKKHSYATYEEALEACNRHKERHPDDNCPIHPYRCKYCGQWHIGHMHTSL